MHRVISGLVNRLRTGFLVGFGVVVGLLTPAAVAFDPLLGDYSRDAALDVRVMAYNHNRNFIEDPSRDAAFDRVLTLLDPDIIVFQEFTSGVSQADISNRLDSILPVGAGANWQIHFGQLGGIRTVIASRYPLLMRRTDTIPQASTRGVTIALADLPDADYPLDIYLLGVHLKCCGNPGGSEDASRQDSADAIANWLGDARGVVRPSGNNIVLPADTPMINLGDFNLVGGPQPENTLITGNIQDEGTYGPDVQGDWDVSDMTNLMPSDPFTGNTFTWQGNGNFAPSALDRMFISDSAITVANSFILNTNTMTPGALANAGLQSGDTLPGNTSDHLPVVMDVRISNVPVCTVDPDCADGVFCNGVETCVANACLPGGDPCPGQICDEGTQACADCFNDPQCDDGLFCNGVETCVAGTCQSGSDPCAPQTCNEATDTCGGGGMPVGDPWINEFHYDNLGGDTGEFVEVAGPAGLDLTGWTVVGYNGSGGSMYQTLNLSGTIPDQGGCMGTLGFAFSGIQNGAPDGLVLVDDLGMVVEFISYEGSFTASNGPASGMNSVDIGVTESSATPVGDSLQLSGTGGQSSDFTWQPFQANTQGLPNTGQVFDGCGGGCTTDPECDDGLFCNGVETCVASACQVGTPVDCDDGVGCTDDSCNEATNQCDNVPNNANCDNGLFCDGLETCDSMSDCQAGTVLNCDDGVGCTNDSCNEGTDQCDNVASNATCDDGLFCNGAETCSAMLDCQAGGDACPGQSCDELADACVECLGDPECDDGNDCNGVEMCVLNSCVNGTPVDCGAMDDDCAVGICNPANGMCEQDVVTLSGAVCRVSANDCDVEETCDGVSPGCPADVCADAGTVCDFGGLPSACDGNCVCLASTVPAASEWGMIVMSLLMLIAGTVAFRGRRAVAGRY